MLGVVQASLKNTLDSGVPAMNFFMFKVMGSVCTTLSQWMIDSLVGVGDVAFSNLHARKNLNRMFHK